MCSAVKGVESLKQFFLHLVCGDADLGGDCATAFAGIFCRLGDADCHTVDGKSGLTVFLEYLRHEAERVVADSEV